MLFNKLLIKAVETYQDIYNGDLGLEEIEQLSLIGDFISQSTGVLSLEQLNDIKVKLSE
ncbi:hypothetical protein [Ureibacillus endophyticus]|uniref:hypothetical protein n=1 Tax=Ureibacillus endophyticus TaxID=1978490 RepID=UPI0014743C07|nr:hypothetical protein [Lysinibacillus endophyticus]